MEKPQKLFKDKIDNSPQPFIPKITYKPFGSWPLDTNKHEHPYAREIKEEKCTLSEMSPPSKYVKPSPQDTAIVWVDNLGELLSVLGELNLSNEVALDLEQHIERSYQGFTCLMQLSTVYHDYIVDTIVLREHMHLLRHYFARPQTVFVVHGQDDTLWLQRDFGLYPRTVFNTQCAAQILGMDLSLHSCVKHYFDVELDKEGQNADWRQRPLSQKMLEYARQDTHYLLPMYCKMKQDLIAKSVFNIEPDVYPTCNNVLYDAIQASRLSNLRVYKKKPIIENPLTDKNFKRGLNEYFVNGRTMDKEMENIIIALFHWRDKAARELDESVSYIMEKRTIFEIGFHKAKTVEAILALCKPMPEVLNRMDELCNVVNVALSKAKQSISENFRSTDHFTPIQSVLNKQNIQPLTTHLQATADSVQMITSTKMKENTINHAASAISVVPQTNNHYKDLAEQAKKYLTSVYQAHFGGCSLNYIEKPGDNRNLCIQLMLHEGLLITVKERRKYGSIEVFASSKLLAEQYAALVACVFLVKIKFEPKPYRTQPEFKRYWDLIKQCDYDLLIQWLINHSMMHAVSTTVQVSPGPILSKPITTPTIVSLAAQAGSHTLQPHQILESTSPITSCTGKDYAHLPKITSNLSLASCDLSHHQRYDIQVATHTNLDIAPTNSGLTTIEKEQSPLTPTLPPILPATTLLASTSLANTLVTSAISPSVSPTLTLLGDRNKYALLCKNCKVVLCSSDLLFAETNGVHSYNNLVLNNVDTKNHPDHDKDPDKLHKLHCKTCAHSVGNIMLFEEQKRINFKKIDILFSHVDFPNKVIAANEWITLARGMKRVSPSYATNQSRNVIPKVQNSTCPLEWRVYKLGLVCNQHIYEHLHGRSFTDFLLITPYQLCTSPFFVSRKGRNFKCTPSFFKHLTLKEDQFQLLDNISSNFVQSIPNIELKDVHSMQVFIVPFLTPFYDQDLPSYFLYLSCVLSAKPALDVIQDEITIVNNANGVSLTLEHLGLVESDSRVLTSNETRAINEAKEIIGKVFNCRLLTSGKTHQIFTCVDFMKNPNSLNFKHESFVSYYQSKGVQIQNLVQPILIASSNPIPFDAVIHSTTEVQTMLQKKPSDCELLPELITLSGITLEMFYAGQLLNEALKNLKKSTAEVTDLLEFQKHLMFSIEDINLLKKVFTSSSAANSDRQVELDYEKEEFLGDAVIDLVVSYYLFISYPLYAEGHLSSERTHIVCNKALQKVAEQLRFQEHIIVSTNSTVQDSQLSDVLEAFVGGLFLDKGLKVAAEFIMKYVVRDSNFNFFVLPPSPENCSIAPSLQQLSAMQRLEDNIKHKFLSQSLFIQALTHASISNTDAIRNKCTIPTYQRLEFLGDAIFKFTAAIHCYKMKYHDTFKSMVEMHQRLVKGTTQVKMAERIGIRQAIFISNNFDVDAVTKSPLSDALEALVAAIFLETGLNPAFKGCCDPASGDGGKVVALLHQLFSYVN